MANKLECSIDGVDYRFSLMGAEKSTELLWEIAGSIMEPMSYVGGAFAGGPGRLLDKDIKPELLATAVKSFFLATDKSKAVRIMKEFIGDDALTANGARIKFNTHFQGRHDHMFKVFYAALEAQYGNFFDAVKGALDFLKPASTPAKIL